MAGFVELIAWVLLASAAITAVLSLALMVGFGIQAMIRREDPVPVRRVTFFAGLVSFDMLLILMFGDLWGDPSPLSTVVVTASFGLITVTTVLMARSRELRQLAESHDEASDDDVLEAEGDH